jgi:[citrate (pro-3S)-lyase] ligase
MNDILPKYGISFIEIPRKEENGAPISASSVRTLLEKNNFDKIKKLVPQSTLEYLKNNCGQKKH